MTSYTAEQTRYLEAHKKTVTHKMRYQ